MNTKTEKKWDTTVVTVDDFSFDFLKENLEYSFPSDRGRKMYDHLGIYRGRPVSAITHYAPIKGVIQDADIDGKYKLMTFGDKAREEGTKVLVEGLKELEEPVKVGEDRGGGIQGFYYTRLEYIKKASTIPELRSFRED